MSRYYHTVFVGVHVFWEGHKSKVKISQNFVAFFEYTNFNKIVKFEIYIQKSKNPYNHCVMVAVHVNSVR